jgi:hypothetical protein
LHFTRFLVSLASPNFLLKRKRNDFRVLSFGNEKENHIFFLHFAHLFVTLHPDKRTDVFQNIQINWRVCWFDRDTHQIIQKTESASFANGGPHKSAFCGLSCKAGGLQRRRALKTFQLGVSSHHWALSSFFLSLNNNI